MCNLMSGIGQTSLNLIGRAQEGVSHGRTSASRSAADVVVESVYRVRQT